MLNNQGGGTHPLKKYTHPGEHHQLDMLAKNRVTPGQYTPLKAVANINNLDNINLTKLKMSRTRITL